MEFEQGYEHTCANRKLLKEVTEQNAHLCDVPVQVGGWVKRFHSCILKESGFFNTLFNTGKFREHFHGIVEIRERRSQILAEAVLFLYNVEPTLDIYNIWEFFEIAEFLMIPRLKAFCVKWLEQTKKTNTLIEICLPICTLFDVDISAVIDYIRQNLRELMNGSELRYIDVNSLNNLLSDKHLSYVPMEIKFRFLLKWVKFDFLNRFQYFEPMCAFIDFWKLSETILVAAKQDPLFSLLEVVSNCEYVQHYDESKAFLTVIAKHQDLSYEKETVIILNDIENEWYRLNMCLSCTGRSKYYTNSIDKSTFYRVRETLSSDTVIELCSADGRIIDHSKVNVNSYEDQARSYSDVLFESICISGRTCVATRIITVEKENQDTAYDNDSDESDVSSVMEEITVIQLLIGYIETDSETTELYPIFSMKAEDDLYLIETTICLNTDGNVAMSIPTNFSTSVFIYNIDLCALRQIENAQVSSDLSIHDCQNGFVIPDDDDITLIRNPHDTSDVQHFESVLALDLECSSDRKMFAIDDKIYRYQYHPCAETYLLDMAVIDEIEQTQNCTCVTWRQLSSPQLTVESINSVIMLELPKNNDRCHLQCPHCEAFPRGRKRRFYETDECCLSHCNACGSKMLSDEQSERESDGSIDGDESDSS